MSYHRTVLDNGMTLLTDSVPGYRSSAVGFYFAGGSRDDTHESAGLCTLAQYMMSKTTKTRQDSAIADSLDRMGAEFNTFVTHDHACFWVHCVDAYFDEGFRILSDMCVNPLFRGSDLDVQRDVIAEQLARSGGSVNQQVIDLFSRALWPGDTLHLPVLGRNDSLRGVDCAALHDYVNRNFTTDRLAVVVVGDVSHEQVVDLARECLTLPEGNRVRRRPASPASGGGLLLPIADEGWTAFCYGTSTMNGRHPDRFGMSILADLLSARLSDDLRWNRGLAAKIECQTNLYRNEGSFMIHANTRTEDAGRVMGLARDEVVRVATEGIPERDIDRARSVWTGRVALESESTRSRMLRLGAGEVVGSEMLSLDEVIERFDGVTGADLRRIASDLVSDAWTLSIAGPFHGGVNQGIPVYLTDPGREPVLEADEDLEMCADDDSPFAWPTTEAEPGLADIGAGYFSWEKGLLKFVGYEVGVTRGLPQSERQRILDSVFTEELPRVNSPAYMQEWSTPLKCARLRKMAESIAAFVRNAKRNSASTYEVAIDEWETDLDYLHARYYVGHCAFPWPSTEG